jgi:hypothetical protein
MSAGVENAGCYPLQFGIGNQHTTRIFFTESDNILMFVNDARVKI